VNYCLKIANFVNGVNFQDTEDRFSVTVATDAQYTPSLKCSKWYTLASI
jgi:hypothetical protein